MTRSLVPFLAVVSGLLLKSSPVAAHGGGFDASRLKTCGQNQNWPKWMFNLDCLESRNEVSEQ